MGRSASESETFTVYKLQLMKNLKNFWMDEAKNTVVATLTLFIYYVFIVISLAWL